MTMKTEAPARLVDLVLTTHRGDTLRIRIDSRDPHWRARAFESLSDPLSPEAFAIRNAPKTRAEEEAWAEHCRVEEQIRRYRELAEARLESEGGK
jgi:hypothetical protein